jgi:hypothetical protein
LFQRILASAGAVLLLLLFGCSGGKNSETDKSQPPSNAVCLDAQREAFPGLVKAWREMATALTAGDNSASPVISEPWTSALEQARAELAKAGCPNPPQELQPLTALTTELNKTTSQITLDQTRKLGALLSELRKTVQVSPVEFDERLLDLPMTCEEISRQVSASYSTRSVPTSKGRDVWAVLSVRNESSRGVYVGVAGELATTRPAKRMSWQPTTPGLSAGPFKTTQHPLLGPDGERVHLSSNGSATSVSLNVSVSFSAEKAADCPIRATRTGGTIKAAAAGDIACDPTDPGYNNGHGIRDRCHQKATSELIKKIKPDAVFALGDLQYQSGSLANFEASYDPTWGRFKDITYPVLGNHEYGSPGAEGYFAYFGSRATPLDPDCLAECRGYYSIDLGAWHLVGLNVVCGELPSGDGCGPKSAQNRWLERDLKAANRTTACTVVLMHSPRWSATHWASPRLDALIKTMHRNGVELVLSGDSHSYERFAPQNPAGAVDRSRGITQFVVGTGGGHHTGLRQAGAPNTLTSKENVFGVLELTLHDGGYKWAYRADPSTPFSDSGSQDCH